MGSYDSRPHDRSGFRNGYSSAVLGQKFMLTKYEVDKLAFSLHPGFEMPVRCVHRPIESQIFTPNSISNFKFSIMVQVQNLFWLIEYTQYVF